MLKTSTIAGTPAYMPFEQLAGKELSSRTDVWAFAMVLWEIMMEQLPWNGAFTDMGQLKEAIVRGDRPPMHRHVTELFPAPYCAMITAGMQFEVTATAPPSPPAPLVHGWAVSSP